MIKLTAVADDNDLFRDESLEVARFEPGQEREIVIPVEVVGEDASAHRFKLSLRLRLDPVR